MPNYTHLKMEAAHQAEMLLNALLEAANAKTDEEKARVAWRFNDRMWRDFPQWGIALPRAFNNILQDKNWPWVEDLWSKEECLAFKADLAARIAAQK